MDGRIRVLHVDDDPHFAELTASYLQQTDDQFTVETAAGSEEGVERLAKGGIDCIVSDYDMPEQNGIEFLEAVRDEHPDLPFILFTGKGSEEVASEAISAGVSDYLQKESSTEQYELLANRIRNYVERYRTQRKLAEKEAHLRQAQAVASLGSWFKDIPSDEIHWSDEVHEIFDIDADEGDRFLNVTTSGQFRECIHPEDRDYVDEKWQEALDGDGYAIEHRIVTGNGTQWVRERADITLDEDGSPMTAHGVVQDITERKERERELEQYERIVETATDAIYTTDQDGRFTMINEKMVADSGYDRDELLGAHVSTLISDADVERGRQLIRELLTNDDMDIAQYEATIETKNGERLPVELRYSLLLDDGEFRGTLGISRDITERKDRERTLTALHGAAREIGRADEPETVYETLIETAEEILDFDLVVVDVEQDGYLVQEAWTLDVEDRKYWERTSLEDDDTFAVRAYNRQETILIDDLQETSIAPADSEYRSALTVPIGKFGTFQAVFSEVGGFDERDREFAELLVDHAYVKLSQLEDKHELRTRTTELERQNERLDEFASIVSHDLRNPLTVANLRLEQVASDCNSEFIADVEDAHDRIANLIEDLLTLARQGEMVGETEQIELAELVSRCWKTVENGDATLDCRTERVVEADESRLAGVLENLFRNSVEHGSTSSDTQSGDSVEHGDEDLTITVGDLPDGFYVADNGDGIPEAERQQVFESGYSSKPDGTGFGLAIVRDIVEAHGWDIDVTENEDGGARFEITGVRSVLEEW